MNRVKVVLVAAFVVIFTNALGAEEVTFAWPDNLKARVDVTIHGSRFVPGEEEHKWDVAASYDLETEKRGNQILIHRRNFDGWNGSMPPKVTWLGEQVVDRVPTMVVSSGGRFIRIEGAAEARQAVRTSS